MAVLGVVRFDLISRLQKLTRIALSPVNRVRTYHALPPMNSEKKHP